jgi:hypothetical protein
MKIEPESEVGKKRTLRTSSRIMITVNGVERHLDVAPWTTLLDALREHLERDSIVDPLGAKGLGEPGVVGVAAAIGHAVFHATGHRVRE